MDHLHLIRFSKANRSSEVWPWFHVNRSGGHRLLVHAAAKSFDVVADVSNHTVPFVAFGGVPALLRRRAVAASSRRSVAVGGGVGGGAGRAFAAAEAVRDYAAAVLHSDGL